MSMSISSTLDGHIEEIIKASKDEVVARVTMPVKENGRDYLIENHEKDNIVTNMFFTWAKFGINQDLGSLSEKTNFIPADGNGKKKEYFQLEETKKGLVVNYVARFKKYIPDYFILNDGQEVGLDILLREGTRIGKLQIVNPNLQVTAGEIIQKVRNGDIHLPAIRAYREDGSCSNGIVKESKIYSDGTVSLPVFPQIHLPDKSLMTLENLVKIIDKRVPREDLLIYQPAANIEDVKVGKDKFGNDILDLSKFDGISVNPESGIVSHTTLFSGKYEVFITSDNHADARVADKNTNGMFFVMPLSNGKKYKVEYIDIKLYRPPAGEEKKFFIQKLPENLDDVLTNEFDITDPKVRYSPEYIVAIQKPDNSIKKMNLRRGNTSDYSKFIKEINKVNEKNKIYISHFPGRGLSSKLLSNVRKISDIYFQNSSFHNDQFFTNIDYVNQKVFTEEGINLYWTGAEEGKIFKFHKGFFVDVEKLPYFQELLSSKKMVQVLGSNLKANPEIAKDIKDTFEAISYIHGGNVAIVNGGHGSHENSVMTLMHKTAKDLNLLYGASTWQIPYEPYTGGADFINSFNRNQLLLRQDIMDEATEANIYFIGGDGTTLESLITTVKKSLKINPYQPQIFVGEYWDKFREWREFMVKEGRSKNFLLNSIYWPRKGSEVKDILRYHFQIMGRDSDIKIDYNNIKK